MAAKQARIGRAQSEIAAAKASEKRVRELASEKLKKMLKADEERLATAYAQAQYEEINGAGLGVGSDEQKARAGKQLKLQQQKEVTARRVRSNQKAAAKAKPGKRG